MTLSKCLAYNCNPETSLKRKGMTNSEDFLVKVAYFDIYIENVYYLRSLGKCYYALFYQICLIKIVSNCDFFINLNKVNKLLLNFYFLYYAYEI